MNFGAFFSGIGFTGLGGFLIWIYYYLYRTGVIGQMYPHRPSYWWLYIGIPLALFGIVSILMSFSPLKYYCSNCGQYLGFESRTCPRCGCNRYTTKDKGIGDTYRRGPYNL